MAQAFARFGVQVTVLEVADRLLAPEEPESSRLLAEVFAKDGIQVLTGATIGSVTYADGRFAVDVDGQVLHADKLLVAAGRRPNLADLGLEHVGLDPSARTVEVDERMRAGDGLWAIGDITGKGAFTHMSMYQAAIAVRDILGRPGPAASYHAVPRVTFTDPEVGSVGLTEQQARDAGLNVRVGVTDLASSTRGWIARSRGAGEARRGRRPRRARRSHLGGSGRGRGALDAHHRRARGGADRDAALDDLRLPDLPPGGRGGARRAGLTAHSSSRVRGGRPEPLWV